MHCTKVPGQGGGWGLLFYLGSDASQKGTYVLFNIRHHIVYLSSNTGGLLFLIFGWEGVFLISKKVPKNLAATKKELSTLTSLAQ